MKRLHLFVTLALLCVLASCTTDPKVKSQNYVDKGNKYFDRNKLKEASIMYRRALQSDQKNAAAWYKLGLLDMKMGNVPEARGSFIRVTDLVESGSPSGLSKDSIEDAYTKTGDIDYIAFLGALQRKQATQTKEFRNELRNCSNKLNSKFPGTFDAYRISGLYDWTMALTPNIVDTNDTARKPEESLHLALDNFMKADHIRPFDTTLGFAIVSTYFDTKQNDKAEQYAKDMIARQKADYRVYDSLWRYYYGTGHSDQAEQVRKQETAAKPNDAQSWLRLASHYATVKNRPEMINALHHLTSDTKTFPNAYMQVGDFYYSNYDLKDAVDEYQQGLKADSSNKMMYLKKSAEALSLEGKYDEASKLVDEALKEDPKDSEAIAMNAALQLNHAKPSDADRIIGELQPLLAKTPGEKVDQATVIHFNMGRAYMLKGDPQSQDQAKLQFEEVLNLRTQAQRPPYIPAVIALAQMQLQRGENPMAVQNAELVLRVAPLNITAHLIRTMGLANLGEHDKARKELDAILKYQPKSSDARFQLARLDLMEKKYPEAEAEFSELMKMNDSRGFSGMLDSKVRQGRTDEAIQMVQGGLAKMPNNPGLLNALAALELGQGKFAESAGVFRKLLDQNPNAELGVREMWALRMGESLRRTGDANGAVAAFNQAAQIAPKDTRPHLEIAMMLESEGKGEEARKAYEDVLKVQPDDPVALNNLAYYNADNDRDLDTALSYAQRAQKKNPQNLNIEDTIGLIYYKKNLLDESSRLFAELVSKMPNNPTFHLHLAMALYKKGDKPQARRELDAARKNRPTNREQDQIKDLMSKIG
jgi:tetratricopeptide (TPR) repeat protein